ncbi:hypothetical protein HNP16_003734 [Aeromonas hydrophila]|nr:hypothetical protein [Aeromonas hydrophila]
MQGNIIAIHDHLHFQQRWARRIGGEAEQVIIKLGNVSQGNARLNVIFYVEITAINLHLFGAFAQKEGGGIGLMGKQQLLLMAKCEHL